jgi:hypothetical protein
MVNELGCCVQQLLVMLIMGSFVSCFCFWFCLLLFMYNSWIFYFCGAQRWNLEVHSSLICENGCGFIGFMCATQGKQHYMDEWLTCVTQLSTTLLKFSVE